MKLHPNVIKIVAELIREGRAGEKPFGILLAAWKKEIAKEEH